MHGETKRLITSFLTGDGLGVEGDYHTELLSHTLEDVAGDPELVGTRDTLARAHLVLPLAGEHLTVDTGDVDAGIQAGTVVSLHQMATEHVLSTNSAVVRALGAGETTCRDDGETTFMWNMWISTRR